MTLREAEDRRRRRSRAEFPLLERDSVLQSIDAALELGRGGESAAMLIEGHAGMGKTRLHDAALERARLLGLTVIRAGGAELEQNLAWGVAAQLLRSLLAPLSPVEREALLQTPAGRVLAPALAGGPAADMAASELTVAHSLFTVIANALENGPGLLALDDLHWADAGSLQAILYILHRLHELPAVLIMTTRSGEGQASSEPLDRIAAHPRVQLHALGPLGPESIAQLVRDSLGERGDAVLIEACSEVTAGNPFYLHELLLALSELRETNGSQLARMARALAPDAVTRALRVRIGRLGSEAAALVRAVAILGEDVPLGLAADLANLTPGAAADAADALAAVEILLAREPLRFVHPLVRQAVLADIPASETATRQLEAARLLAAGGGEPERVAAHLLLGRPEGDPWVVEQLRGAARAAQRASAPGSAVRYLQRALEEPPPDAVHGAVLAELGAAETVAGAPSAIEHLSEAAPLLSDPREQAELALTLGRALLGQGQHERAAEAYDEGLRRLAQGGPELEELPLHEELQTGFIATAALSPALHAEAASRSAALMPRALAGPTSHAQRMLLAQAGIQACFGGEPAAQVVALCERAWDSGRLLSDEGPDGISWSLITMALCLASELERCLEITEAVLAAARERSLPMAYATVSYVRAMPLLTQGRVREAQAEVEQALDARRYGWRQHSRAACGVYANCLIESGELLLAELALFDEGEVREPQDLEDVYRLWTRGRLRLAQGRAGEALQTSLLVGKALELAGVRLLETTPWRLTGAEAALVLGRRDQAVQLAQEQHEIAERVGALHSRIRATTMLGLCSEPEPGLKLLARACELAESGPACVDGIRAWVELGAALRRANRRSEAREWLERAVDAAGEGGARTLYERARTELSATGARPRREALLRGPKSLTPSERRIAEMAASGYSNREIAQALFVTPKTIEYHLRNAFRKLEIERRQELPDALDE
jgi:DNA-binding CsgD family transcriptional regulator